MLFWIRMPALYALNQFYLNIFVIKIVNKGLEKYITTPPTLTS